MSRLSSGQVVGADGQFISLQDTERYLGTPDTNGKVLASDTDGTRYWTTASGAQGTIGSQGLQGIQGLIGEGTQGTTGSQGLQGIQGQTGVSGNEGSQGTQGTTGSQGLQGIQGQTGVSGNEGSQGTQGTTGSQGLQGSIGPQGLQGIQGIQGAGIQGSAGTSVSIIGSVADVNGTYPGGGPNNPQGLLNYYFPSAVSGNGVIDDATGELWVYDGSTWNNVGQIVGPDGAQGIQGTIGPQGIQGTIGPQGIQGIQGRQGITGSQGTSGLTGGTGSQGIQGTIGPQGIQGIQGRQGITGSQGTSGLTGGTGSQGIQGTIGPQGIQGIQGRQGITGSQGTSGLTGGTGSQGIQGIFGPTGPQGIQGIQGGLGLQGIQGISGPSSIINSAAVTTNATFYPVFVEGTGNRTPSIRTTATAFTFNPSTGTLVVPGDVNSGSDIRFKKDVETVNNALEMIENIRGVKFTWRESGKPSLGVIAQELEEILPELVAGVDNKTVNYSGLIAVLIEAIKELKERVEVLEQNSKYLE